MINGMSNYLSYKLHTVYDLKKFFSKNMVSSYYQSKMKIKKHHGFRFTSNGLEIKEWERTDWKIWNSFEGKMILEEYVDFPESFPEIKIKSLTLEKVRGLQKIIPYLGESGKLYFTDIIDGGLGYQYTPMRFVPIQKCEISVDESDIESVVKSIKRQEI
eukprot:TRINITY_DN515_c2_g1_i2.p1 TRINITY_DN515_c2_g1~~TRINITY_DN515_c2_g1_i2.p1  ORF type:complete len:159 (+),score=31.72 TRINITY_DN515_c2_g1_i2:259-735(+)